MPPRRRRLIVFCVGLVALIGVTLDARAQDVSVGYQVQHLWSFENSISAGLGINVDGAFAIPKRLAMLGQIDWSRSAASTLAAGVTTHTTSNYTTFGGGVRWSLTNASTSPFIDVVVGRTHSSHASTATAAGAQASATSAATDTMLQLGGGIAMRLSDTRRIVGQVDYRHVFAVGQGSTGVHTVRVVIGMRLSR